MMILYGTDGVVYVSMSTSTTRGKENTGLVWSLLSLACYADAENDDGARASVMMTGPNKLPFGS